MKRMSFSFYNLAPAGDPNRGPEFVERELNGIANNLNPDKLRRRPKVLAVSEAINRTLPQLARYTLVRSAANLSVANLALYIRDDLEHGLPVWHMHAETWPRVLHSGTHEPRATLVVPVAGWRIIVGHAPQVPPPERDDDTERDREVRAGLIRARAEWLDILEKFMRAGKGPTLLLSDPNGLADDLRKRVPGSDMKGTAVEAVNGKGVVLEAVHTPGTVNGVPMLSDHKVALLGRAVRR